MIKTEVKKELSLLSKKYNIRLGLAGSVVHGSESSSSDIDVVIENSNCLDLSYMYDISEYLLKQFNKPVDFLALDLLREEDEEMDTELKEMGLDINHSSIYKTILREVEWCD